MPNHNLANGVINIIDLLNTNNLLDMRLDFGALQREMNLCSRGAYR